MQIVVSYVLQYLSIALLLVVYISISIKNYDQKYLLTCSNKKSIDWEMTAGIHYK